jgi:bacterioferritin-associated ferredoxin
VYICICNALTERQVDDAVRQGASRPAQVYRHHACRPQCGKCVREVEDKVREGARRDQSQHGLPVIEG